MESMICTLLPPVLETKARCGNPLVLWVGLAPLHPKQMASRAQRKEMAPNLKLGTLGSTWMIKGEKPNYSRAAEARTAAARRSCPEHRDSWGSVPPLSCPGIGEDKWKREPGRVECRRSRKARNEGQSRHDESKSFMENGYPQRLAASLTRREFMSQTGKLSTAVAAGVILGDVDGTSKQASSGSGLVMMNACDLSRAIRARQVSCQEVMTAYLSHIERLNPKVNAIVSLQPREGLMKQAAER